MVFSSYSFILAFLPVVLVVYFLLAKFADKRIQHLFLVVASLFFYGYTNIYYIFLILSSVLANYACGIGMLNQSKNQVGKKAVFIAGILFNVGLLGYFKYYDFFIENINVVFKEDFTLKHIILPIGISFYTFQQIAFLISVYKNEERPSSFLDYILLVTFFPQLVAGPIVFYNELVPQFKDDRRRYFNSANFAQGLFIFVIGVFKKAVIADNFGLIVDNGYHDPSSLSFGGAWVVSLSYSLQIYFDFSGYSEMALGLGKMFNFDFPVNFYSPYKSKSITEFWRRWHITLGKSLTKLIYIPLGGNRKGLPRTCVNLFIVFLVSGIWHGAAWTFVIWGVAYGIFRVVEKLFDPVIEKVPSFIRIAVTFLIVNSLWVLFRAPTFESAFKVLEKMYDFTNISFLKIASLLKDGTITYPAPVSVGYIIGMIVVLYGMIFICKKNAVDYFYEFKPGYKSLILISVLFCIGIIHMSRSSIFIYFNF